MSQLKVEYVIQDRVSGIWRDLQVISNGKADDVIRAKRNFRSLLSTNPKVEFRLFKRTSTLIMDRVFPSPT